MDLQVRSQAAARFHAPQIPPLSLSASFVILNGYMKPHGRISLAGLHSATLTLYERRKLTRLLFGANMYCIKSNLILHVQ